MEQEGLVSMGNSNVELDEELHIDGPAWASSLNQNQLKGAELMALGSYTQKQVAQMVGVEEQTISRRWKKNPIFMRYLEYLTTINTLDAALAVKGLTLEAIKTYSDLLKNGNDNIKYRVAKDILDRAGVKDLKFDLLPKEEKKENVDTDEVKNRIYAIVESDSAVGFIKELQSFMVLGKKSEEVTIDAEFDVNEADLNSIDQAINVHGQGVEIEDEVSGL